MSNTFKNDWSNYWQGRSANETGDALVGVGIEDNETLNTHWAKFFSSSNKNKSVLDMACGAGSVLKHAHEAGFKNLTGIDFSKSAIGILLEKFPSASGYVASVDALPFEENSFDYVVSQFGFEYAGDLAMKIRAAKEMTRVVRNNGNISLISHMKGSVIEIGCQKSLTQIAIVKESGFLAATQDFFDIIFEPGKGKTSLETAMANLNTKAEPIMELLRKEKNSKNRFIQFTLHMMQSAHRLISSHQNYSYQDVSGWVDQVQFEIDSYHGRMSSMISSAITQKDAKEIIDVFLKSGLIVARSHELLFQNNKKPAAWIITASSS